MTRLYLEDFAVGQKYGTKRVRVDAEAIKAFAATFDPQPFHLDEEAARASFFQGLSASGWHTAALTMRLLVDGDLKPAGGIIGAWAEEMKWPRAVRPGDELQVEAEVLAVRSSQSRPGQGFVKVRSTTLNQSREPVLVMDLLVQARKAAREQIDHGADWVKVYMTHRSWLDKNENLVSQPTLTVEELKAIVDEAHGWGKKVACHAYNGPGLHRALDGGCDSIEHGLELDDAAVAQMAKQGTWYCPTLSVYYHEWGPEDTPQGRKDRKRVALHGPSFQKAMKAGVKIVFGTDVGGFPWSEPIAQEFGHMVELGMSPAAAIRAATSAPAEMLGMAGELGVIAPGAYADVIAVRGDPLKDVAELGRVGFVMKDGMVFKDELAAR